LVVLEAMASKVPVVAFAVGGIPEFLRDEKDGYLVPPNDVDKLAEKILILLQNPDLRVDFGNNGYQHAKNFSINKNVKQIENIYKEILNR